MNGYILAALMCMGFVALGALLAAWVVVLWKVVSKL